MRLSTKIVYLSSIVVWLSVLVKYKSFGLISRSSLQLDEDHKTSDEGFRFRQTFRKNIDKIRNKEPETENKINENSDLHNEIYDDATDSKNSRTRFRDKIKDAYRGVSDKVKISTKPSNFRPMYNFSSMPNSNELYDKRPEEADIYVKSIPYSESNAENLPLPHKPGDNSFEKLIDLAKKIIETGNYNRRGQNNHNYLVATYNSYNYRPGEYATTIGSVCSNYLEFGGVVFGKYLCPVSGYSLASTLCCGNTNEQFCCEPVGHKDSMNSTKKEMPKFFYLFVLICFFLVFVVILSIFVFIGRKKIWKEKYKGVKDEDKEKEDAWIDDELNDD